MYKTIISNLIRSHQTLFNFPTEEAFLQYSYVTTKEDFYKKIFEIIESFSFDYSKENSKFFEDLILALVESKCLLKDTRIFLIIIMKTRKKVFFQNLLYSSVKIKFINETFKNYSNLTLNEKNNFVSILLKFNVPKKDIMNYLIENSQMSSLYQYDDDIVIHFITDCSINPNTPLIHNLSKDALITFEYNGSVFYKSIVPFALDGEYIIETFKKLVPNYFGVIRVWKGLEQNFLGNIDENFIPISFEEILKVEENENLYLYYELNDTLDISVG